MEFKVLFESIKDAWQNSPVLISLAALGFCIFAFIIVDAHRNKKKRARHRWK